MKQRTFASIRVIDASNNIPGQYAARLLADFGADVVLAEPDGGTPTRSVPPMAASASLLFEHLNAGKRSVPAHDSDAVAAWAATADVVIVGDTEQAASLIRQGTPALVATATEFSPTGAYADWHGSELIHQALSGTMFYTGLADREPLFGVGHRASYATGTQLYIGIVAALFQRRTAGAAPRQVTVSVHESAAAMEQNFSTQFGYNGTFPRRGEQNRPRGYARCRDGWVVYFARFGQWRDFCDVFEAHTLVDDPRFATWGDLVKNWPAAAAALHEHAAVVDVADVFEAARERKLVLAPMVSLRALVDEPHLRGRDYWSDVDGQVPVALGPLFRPSLSACDRTRPAPAEVRPATPDVRHPDSVLSASAPSTLPLDGVRVLDVTSAWAGPMATRLLASLGADVVKLEGPGRPDSWRGEPHNPPSLHPYPDRDPGDRPFDRHAWFNSQNQDKRSLVLDTKSDRGLELARRVVEHSDVIIANWSPGALDRAGLGYDDARTINDDIIVVEMPAISSSGPLAMLRGLGPTMEAMSGISGLIGYPDDRPLGSGSAYLDPTGGLHGAAATVTALFHRTLDGDGQSIEVPQREAAMQWIGELILDTIVNGADHGAAGNSDDHAAPFGAFRTHGDDEWIAIEVRTDDEWAALCDVLTVGHDDRDRFADAGDRIRHRSELDTIVADHVASADKHKLAERLQQAGVRAAPVQNGKDLFLDPHLRERGWFTELDHAHAGTKEYPGLPLEFDGRRSAPLSAAPTFGQHSFEILNELLGLDATEFEALRTAGVTADEPGGRDAR